MIRSIKIQVADTCYGKGQTLEGLSKHNFIYGSNGTGKTIISRVIADESNFSDCEINWENRIKLETFVYNRDFIDKNFNQLKGIFTLGEKNQDNINQINNLKEQLDSLKAEKVNLQNTLKGNDGAGGKQAELTTLENKFKEICWRLKQKYDAKFKGTFTGYRDKREKFKDKILSENLNNSAKLQSLDELERTANTIFNKDLSLVKEIPLPDYACLLDLEALPILEKKVIGKKDIDIGAMIEKLGNSDWVKQGRAFYEKNNNVCPFCQQEIQTNFANSLNQYFDETFANDTEEIDKLLDNYKKYSAILQQTLQTILENPTELLDAEKLKEKKIHLDTRIRYNINLLNKKENEPSQVIQLDSLKDIFEDIKGIISAANQKIIEHNNIVSNFDEKKKDLNEKVWRFLTTEIAKELREYNLAKGNLEKAINNLHAKMENKNKEHQQQEAKIKELENSITSIKPTINSINSLLQSFGFSGFYLAEATEKGFYKIQRTDGTDAKETLSDGEKSFVSFLYFYHLLKGSKLQSGITTDRVVVFDDPVSSVDSDVLFIVSTLIKGLFEDIRNDRGYIKQLFILTHNIYFHREVTFNPKRSEQALNEETFWIIRKTNQCSKVTRYNSNPIKTSYELLWSELKNTNDFNIYIQNILRRILESYFKILGNQDFDFICNHFDGEKKLICKSLLSWMHAGSHCALDDLYISNDDYPIDSYRNIFKEIFEKTGHGSHYNMMMGGCLQ